MHHHLLSGSFHPAVLHGGGVGSAHGLRMALGMGWFGHQVMSALIHSAIYGVMYHIFRGLGLFGSIVTGAAILAASWLVYRLLNRS